MSKLITLGCSVTAYPGVKERLSELLHLPNLNLSYPAGSNQLQISRLMELLVYNKIDKDDIIYWQITNSGRSCLRLKMTHKRQVEKIQEQQFKMPFHHYTTSEFENIFDGEKRLDILCNSPLLKQVNHSFDEEEEVQKLLGTMILLKKFCDKMIVVFGWEGVLTPNQEETFRQVLDSYSIAHIEGHFVDYAKNRNMLMMDDRHPSTEAGEVYAEEVIFEKIKSLDWNIGP
jgi:hypothetical protein